MITLTETITQKLLDAAADPAGLEKVFEEYGKSKGPFYHALAQATGILSENLTTLSGECNEMGEKYAGLQQKIKQVVQELSHQEELLETKKKELVALDKAVDQKKKLLDQAKALAGLDFECDDLSHLHNLLVQLAAEQGAKPGEVAGLFFDQVSHYGSIIALEMEEKRAAMAAKKARAEAEYWQTEAKTAEAKAKARKVAIDYTDKLLSQGVKQDDIPRWSFILAKSGVTPEKLVESLEHFASLEKVYQDRQQQKDKLEGQIKQLTSQVNTLTEDREKVTAAIGGVKETALTAIENMSKKALEHLALLSEKADKYEQWVREAAVLEAELAIARALKSQDPGLWKGVQRQEIRDFLAGIIVWSRLDVKNNPFLPEPPESVARSAHFYSHLPVCLKDVLFWALAGLFTPEERKVLAGSR